MRLKTAIVIGIVLGVLSQYTRAEELGEEVKRLQPTVTVVGNDDLLSLRVGVRPWAGRTEIGLFGIWMDGLVEGDQKSDDSVNQLESWGGGVFATYDVVQDAAFTVLSYQVPVDVYVGGQLGAVHLDNGNDDATAALMTGVMFGDAGVKIGVEYSYQLSRDLWKEFGTFDDKHRLLLSLGVRF